MLLASHALASGPLAASQPGFTVLDPLSAGLLGVFLFDEHIRTGVLDLAGEAVALAVVIAGARLDPQPQLPDPWRGREVAGTVPAVGIPASAGRLEFEYQQPGASEMHTAEALPSGPSRSAPAAGRVPTSPPVDRASGPPRL